MLQQSLEALAVVGRLQRDSASRTLVQQIPERLKATSRADIVKFREEPLALYDPDSAHKLPDYERLWRSVDRPTLLSRTPDYDGSISSAMKNFLDHFWKRIAGKLFVTILSDLQKKPGRDRPTPDGRATMPCVDPAVRYWIHYGVEIKNGEIASEAFPNRPERVVSDLCIYGDPLTPQTHGFNGR